jgi:hypothetical protein
VAVPDPSGVKVPIRTDIIDEIPIARAILLQVIGTGFDLDQVSGRFLPPELPFG